MTTIGLGRQLYSQYVMPRPFSRFTKDEYERQANDAWGVIADLWARTFMNEAGGLNAAGVQRYIIKSKG